MFQHQFVNSLTGLLCLFGNFGRILIPDDRVEGRHNTDTVVNIFPAFLLIGRNAVYAQSTQCIEAIHQQIGRFKATLCHHRFHRIQLHLSRFATHSHAKVVAYHFIVDLVHHFGDNRIYLTGHDRRTGLHGRQINLTQPATRTGCQKT